MGGLTKALPIVLATQLCVISTITIGVSSMYHADFVTIGQIIFVMGAGLAFLKTHFAQEATDAKVIETAAKLATELKAIQDKQAQDRIAADDKLAKELLEAADKLAIQTLDKAEALATKVLNEREAAAKERLKTAEVIKELSHKADEIKADVAEVKEKANGTNTIKLIEAVAAAVAISPREPTPVTIVPADDPLPVKETPPK